MLKTFRLALLLPLLLLSSNCAGKLPANATPQDKSNLVRLNIASAIDDSIDGIVAANTAQYLNDKDTVLVLQSLHVVLESLKDSSDPKATTLAAIADLKKQLLLQTSSGWNVANWYPYLDSLATIVSAL